MKKKLDKTICFDLDGVICTNTWGEYSKAKPYEDAILKINDLYNKGVKIIIYTSRYMGRYNSDVEKVYNHGFDFTKKQIDDWGLRYHKLLLGKPSYDIIVDDKSFNYNDSWISKIGN